MYNAHSQFFMFFMYSAKINYSLSLSLSYIYIYIYIWIFSHVHFILFPNTSGSDKGNFNSSQVHL